MTSDAEEALAFQMRAVGTLPSPEREWVFAHPRRWRFDFAFLIERVAVEVEGGSWVAGRHTRPEGFASDIEKYNEAAIRGWSVIRVTPKMVESGDALSVIERALIAADARLRL